jgi:hypothetical protein
VDAGGDAARDRPAPEAVTRERRCVEPGMAGPVLDDQRDRIGVDRVVAEAVTRRCTLLPHALGEARRRQLPDPPEQRALGDRRGGEPGLERGDRTELGAPLRQPELGAAGVLIVLAVVVRDPDSKIVRSLLLIRRQ